MTSSYADHSYICSVAFRAIGNRYTQPIPTYLGIKNIPASCHGLFHKVGGGQGISHQLTSVAHLQANEEVKVINQAFFKGLRRGLAKLKDHGLTSSTMYFKHTE